ncbi:MAG: hypothetical protein HY259_12765 [Chloroflexi bacterium]|nr:hypothetical protein [Chloroflexota bacterium]
MSEPVGQIAFIGEDGNLWLVELPGQLAQRLTEGERVLGFNWSPDGALIAYVHETGARHEREIVLLTLDTRARRTATALRDPLLSSAPWSPDGRYLVGHRGCCATGQSLVLLDPNGTQVQREVVYSFGYAWSPDGAYLALGRDESVDPPIAVESGKSASLVLLDTNTGRETILVRGTRESFYWPWCWLSPTHLVFLERKWQSDQSQLWQVAVDAPTSVPETTRDVPLNCDSAALSQMLPPTLRTGIGVPSWSADQRWVVFAAGQGETRNIYLFDTTSYAPRLLVRGTEPAWQPVKIR